MPAIDLDDLRHWSQNLGDHVSEPEMFSSMLKRQLEAHSNRLLRRGPSLARHGALPSWNTPPAMLNEIEAAILPRAALQPEAALRLADHLWSLPSLEEKILAARLVGAAGRSEASHMRLARWVMESKDQALHEALARHAARPIRAESPDLFRHDVIAFLGERISGARRFGWRVLLEWMDESPSTASRLALEVLPRALREGDPECVRFSQLVLARVAEASPAEVLGWLAGLPDRDAQITGRRWLRGAIPSLRPEVAAAVRARLEPDAVQSGRSE